MHSSQFRKRKPTPSKPDLGIAVLTESEELIETCIQIVETYILPNSPGEITGLPRFIRTKLLKDITAVMAEADHLNSADTVGSKTDWSHVPNPTAYDGARGYVLDEILRPEYEAFERAILKSKVSISVPLLITTMFAMFGLIGCFLIPFVEVSSWIKIIP